MTSEHKFPNDPTAVRAARQFALEQLGGYPPELLEVVELLVSELATNSVLHTDSGFTLRIEADPQQIHISVTDHGSGQPELQELDPQRLSGRGLALVEMFSSSWGVRPSRAAAVGKTVWLVLDVAAPGRQIGDGARAGRRSSEHRSTAAGAGPRRRGPRGGPQALAPRGGAHLARRHR
jgi:anti-sigma regulatory factor (Ser/Thr protein kinase)